MSDDPAAADASVLLDQVSTFIRRYVVLNSYECVAVSLWVLHTHAVEAADATPYLSVSSAEKESGKTRLLEVLALLVKEPLATANISDAALFRAVTEKQPTLLFDEIDAVFGPKARDREDLRGMLNAGYRRGSFVYRMGGTRMTTLETFQVFCPKVLAGLGNLPDTLQSRCIPIRLKRKAPHEHVDRFRHRDALQEADTLRALLSGWAQASNDELREARPTLPDQLGDWEADVWEPLLAIADQAQSSWPDKGRTAAITLSAGQPETEESLGVQLLHDCKTMFDQLGVDRIASAQLINELERDEEGPWADWRGTGKPINARTLARLLRPYDIRSRSIRLANGDTPKGFHRDQFQDSWARYLPTETPASRHSATTPTVEPKTPEPDPPQDPSVAERTRTQNPHQTSHVADVADAVAHNSNADDTVVGSNAWLLRILKETST